MLLVRNQLEVLKVHLLHTAKALLSTESVTSFYDCYLRHLTNILCFALKKREEEVYSQSVPQFFF